MKLGANSVLFGGYDMATAFRCIKMAGYDGIEVSAIDGMSQHLVLDHWEEIAPEVKRLSREYGLELLAMEQPRQEVTKLSRLPRSACAGLQPSSTPHLRLVGTIGVLRFPDFYTRLHAASITDTSGAALVLIGMVGIRQQHGGRGGGGAEKQRQSDGRRGGHYGVPPGGATCNANPVCRISWSVETNGVTTRESVPSLRRISSPSPRYNTR